jgi:N-acetylglucosamine-6-phosphate deacetylase
VLCGTLLSMASAQRNMNTLVGRRLHEVISMATRNPARVLGIADQMGSLEPGKEANVVVCDADMNVRLTMVGGRVVYHTSGS